MPRRVGGVVEECCWMLSSICACLLRSLVFRIPLKIRVTLRCANCNTVFSGRPEVKLSVVPTINFLFSRHLVKVLVIRSHSSWAVSEDHCLLSIRM